jgi:hypothetical protein
LAETTGQAKNQIASIFSALNELIGKELGKKGPGQFIVPGLFIVRGVPQAVDVGAAWHGRVHR